jgi:hypothetical protein
MGGGRLGHRGPGPRGGGRAVKREERRGVRSGWLFCSLVLPVRRYLQNRTALGLSCLTWPRYLLFYDIKRGRSGGSKCVAWAANCLPVSSPLGEEYRDRFPVKEEGENVVNNDRLPNADGPVDVVGKRIASTGKKKKEKTFHCRDLNPDRLGESQVS